MSGENRTTYTYVGGLFNDVTAAARKARLHNVTEKKANSCWRGEAGWGNDSPAAPFRRKSTAKQMVRYIVSPSRQIHIYRYACTYVLLCPVPLAVIG